MSKLNDLITKLCPGGVPYKKLNEVLNYEQPSKYLVSSKDYSDEYSTPVLTAGKTFILGYTNEVNGIYQASKDNPVIIFDDFTTDFKWVDFPFKAKSSGMKMLTPIDSNTCCFRYIYYAMSVIDFVPSDHKRHWISQYSNFTIPLPPLPVQSEIVRILDSFTELEAELEAELAGRIEQYEYFRDHLLDKKNLEAMDGKPVETKKLGEIEKDGLIKLGRGNVISKRDIANNPGTYPIYSASVMNNGKFGEYGDYMFDDIRLTWSIDGGGRFFYRDDEKYSVTNVCGWLKVLDENAFNPKFLFYVLISQWSKLVFNYTIKAHPSVIRNMYDIPMVSLATQERIVDILDRFDALTTSLTDGIPAEIEMRREQYEYYRSRLLDFPRLPEDSNNDGE